MKSGRKLKKSSSKKSKKASTPEVYDSLDAPVLIWNRVHETSDVSYLLMKRKPLTKKLRLLLEKVWEELYNEYIKVFGYSSSFIQITERIKKIGLLKVKMILTGDLSIENFIEIEENKLKDLQSRSVKSDFMKTKQQIEKHLGFHLSLKEVSIREFYSYLKNMK